VRTGTQTTCVWSGGSHLSPSEDDVDQVLRGRHGRHLLEVVDHHDALLPCRAVDSPNARDGVLVRVVSEQSGCCQTTAAVHGRMFHRFCGGSGGGLCLEATTE